MYVITFLIILAVLVLVHEFGHFFSAKKFGVRVDEFGLGFPPRLWSIRKGETTYSLNAIPFGGFVKIFGETESAESAPDADLATSTESERSFVGKPRLVQAIILLAGIIMNVVFAWLLFSIAYMSGMTTGISSQDAKYITDSHVVVLDVLPGSPAALAGFQEGDELLSYSDPAAIQEITKDSAGKPITFQVLRLAETKDVTVTPERSSQTGNYMIGISMDTVGKASLPFYLAFWEGAKLTGRLFIGIVGGIYMLIHDAVLGHPDFSQISGPIGIARLVGDASKLGFAYLLSFTAFISLNLAVLNLIPFPALDGGRILFVAIEAIRRKSIDPKVANTVNAIGFGLLIILMLFVTYRDIVNISG
ncbi:MAG: site-2 protease family protein [Patescibacteria group bacterium]|nr:site-2 protease family protein [Patescibacteria group bacterium]MDE2116393.1 site-2 protease family protein [Patescibacteria group bacterium]